MASGLAALLDDVAAIAKLAAASLDDVSAAAGKAGTKAAGVVIDDTAVTPRYVTGFTPERELPIIWKIAVGSLRNKLLLLLPAALLLSAFAPWAITPILMVGGAYLCFEGAEKLIEALSGHGKHADEAEAGGDPAELEKTKIAGAIRTDLILSGEIMAIALAEVQSGGAVPLWEQAIVLALVGAAVTVGVYGVVALIVKMDDIGVHLAARDSAAVQGLGRGLVKFMPVLLSALATIGTAAMIWVGGGIIVHGLHEYHLTPLPEWIEHLAGGAAHAVPVAEGLVHWVVEAACFGVVGVILGGVIALVVHKVAAMRGGH
ncbi:hypothetical protein FHS96_003418 [Sphingomonas zeicaulis]|uniref:DUF808 domain-containing protein n=1 Tax=Sphingomonas zeicaulis TaxID=1632740 RepID=UPI003D1CD5CA